MIILISSGQAGVCVCVEGGGEKRGGGEWGILTTNIVIYLSPVRSFFQYLFLFHRLPLGSFINEFQTVRLTLHLMIEFLDLFNSEAFATIRLAQTAGFWM